MIKRIKCISSLLVILVCAMSIVPAKAADEKELQRLEVNDGIINQAKTLSWNKFCIEAEINGEDNAFYFINEKGDYIKLDTDPDKDYEIKDLYEEDKYLLMKDDMDNEYWYDTATGKEVDARDNQDEIDRKLAKTIKRVIKKDDDGLFDESKYNDSLVEVGAGLGKAQGGTSVFMYPLNEANLIGIDTGAIFATGTDGEYVYASYDLGNIYVATTHGAVTVKNTKDTYEIKDNGETYQLKAVLDKPLFSISGGEAGTYDIYQDLSIWMRKKGDTNGDYEGYENVTDRVELGSKSCHYNMWTDNPVYTASNEENGEHSYGKYVRIFQRISTNPSETDTIKGIKLPNKVDTYFLCDEDGTLYTPETMKFLVRNTFAIDLSVLFDSNVDSLTMQAINFKKKDGLKYVDAGKLVTISNFDKYLFGWGLPRVLDGSYVYGFDPNEEKFVKIFKISPAMDEIDTSTPAELIAWNHDLGGYSFTGMTFNDYIASKMNKPTTTQVDADTISTTPASVSVQVSTGWVSDQSKNWSYILQDGTKAKGWVNDKGTWYYLSEDGAMRTGWINDNGTWYYCNISGAMLADTTVDGYILDSNGAWIN